MAGDHREEWATDPIWRKVGGRAQGWDETYQSGNCPLCMGGTTHELKGKERKEFVGDESPEGLRKAWSEPYHKYERGDRIAKLFKCENCGAVTEHID